MVKGEHRGAPPRKRSRAIRSYLTSLLIVAASVGLRWLLDPLLGERHPAVTMYAAVALSVYFCGLWPAIVAALAGYLAATYLFIEPRGVLGLDDPGDLVGLLAYLSSCAIIIALGAIARRAQLEEREGREFLRTTLGSIGDAVITTDVQGRVSSMNAVAETLTGWTQSDAQGKPLEDVFQIINEQTRQPAPSPVARALEDGVTAALANHTTLVRKDGTEFLIDDSAAPIHDEQGRLRGCVMVFRDETRRRRFEESQAFLAAIVTDSEDAIISKSLQGTIRTWNAGAERLFGYTAAEAVGQQIELIIPADRLGEEREILRKLRRGERTEHFETVRVRKDGKLVDVSLTISPVRNPLGEIIGASKVARDITDQKQAEETHARLAAIVTDSEDAIISKSLEGRIRTWNTGAEHMFGYTEAEAVGQSIELLIPPELRDEERSILTRLRNGERIEHFDTVRVAKDGKRIQVSLTISPVRNAAGEIIGASKVAHDVTERKTTEEKLKLADQRKDEFLATLAHELRNPLAPIRNSLEIMKRRDVPDELIAQARGTLDRQLSQMERLIDDLLDVSRITRNRLELRKERVELSSILHQAIETSRPLARLLEHEVSLLLPQRPIHLDADPVRLAQVFSNLLNNACKFMAPRGRVVVEAVREGESVAVSVTDSGIGIAPETLPRIFEMFTQGDSTLERVRGGLGIGLTLVKRLVEMHGGTVEATSAGKDLGSKFVVRLPVSIEQPAAAAVPESPDPGTAIRPRRILVVDDNRDSAESLATLLELSGHATKVAYDGLEAVAVARSFEPEIVLLDIGLPGLNGFDVCRRLRAEPAGKDVAIVALTGWGQAEDRRRSTEAGFDHHLVKPVDPASLMRLLAELSAHV